jgi:hypothetical protein
MGTEFCFILMLKSLFLQLFDKQVFKHKLQLTLLT